MKNKTNTALIAVICVLIAIVFCAAVFFLVKGKSGDAENEESFQGPLPDSYVGSWALPADSHVLQSPRTADMTEDEVLADENDFGLMLTYGIYSSHRIGSVNNPTYKLEKNCGTDAMDEQGMQSSGIMDEFNSNASISKIEVYNEDGSQLCDTVFIIDDQYLVYYGTGNYVFCAVKLDAVG